MSFPPLNGLLALEAVARLESVSRAADELGVTQPAISQRLRMLERYFGRKLIERTPNGFHMEDDVAVFAARLRSAIETIRTASENFEDFSRARENQLTVAILSTFAQRWLIPRLSRFQRAHPEIDLRLMTTSDPKDLARRDADVSIRCGSGQWQGCESRFLMSNRIFPVASPRYLEEIKLSSIEDLRNAVCIRVDAVPRQQDWMRWLDSVGAAGIAPRAWQSYANSTHALEAATAGLGIAMAHSPFVSDSLASGRLVRPFPLECDDVDGDYYLVHEKSPDLPRRIRRFRTWLNEEAEQDGHAL
jgi:LysR family glycine cleavage system transcriptional activator